ncbi:hypothetical protein ACIBKX_06045 [Streptomyces sp. NPDC050658]|uniref:hypothetical protein n=1 Tax=unclassified Streptomyces TaxID=2593676 RepID=UPI003444E5C5
MRLRRFLASGATAAALVVAGAVPSAVGAVASGQPTCFSATRGEFPIGARIEGGPDTYVSGGGFRSWTVELKNGTRGRCGEIHPVVVLVDRERELRPGQIRLEFHDGERWRPVRFERTDRDENVGVFGEGGAEGSDGSDGFGGFTVGAGRTRAVKVRMAFTSDARSERAVVSAAVVQRRADDGEWVGESGEYAFAIGAGEDGDAGRVGGEEREGGRSEDPDASSYADELAATGPGLLLGVGAGAVGLFVGGWGLMVVTRRLRG